MASSRELARFVAQATPRSVPKRLIGLAKRYALDTVGCAVYGATKPWSKIIAARGRKTGRAASGGAVVIGADWKATAPIAALVNGSQAHAFELDDVHDESLIHPGAVVVPAAALPNTQLVPVGWKPFSMWWTWPAARPARLATS